MVQIVEKNIKINKTPEETFLMEVVCQHFLVKKQDYTEVPFKGEKGIEDTFKRLEKHNWNLVYDQDKLVGLDKNYSQITFGLGGQINFAIENLDDLGKFNLEYFQFLKDIFPILEELGYVLLTIGYLPNKKTDEIEEGLASTIISVLYEDEDDFEKKLRIIHALLPVMNILFDNSPYYQGALYKGRCLRQDILGYDYPKSFSYKEYRGSNKQIIVNKNITIKAADALPYPLNLAYLALWKGLIGNKENVEALIEFINTLTQDEFQKLELLSKVQGLEVKIGEGTLKDLAADLYFIAGSKLNEKEKIFLQPLEAIIFKNILPKEVTLRQLKED